MEKTLYVCEVIVYRYAIDKNGDRDGHKLPIVARRAYRNFEEAIKMAMKEFETYELTNLGFDADEEEKIVIMNESDYTGEYDIKATIFKVSFID